ncbi:MAG: 1-(5-phosphoribosyl)-5-[(5-phosphoribosylamino)methylideneamino]imidazole-4-carboxamide isomerase [Bacillota bacterium]|jgi:phosphoribosylformimino-5-aminoimidazole carboxamide ribotide isomerase
MIIIPAVDIREGKCVRLVEGKMDRVTVYSEDPVAVAQLWEDKGAEIIHVVDLDGAFAGHPKNLAIIEKIVNTVQIPVQIGGGIRNMDTIDMLLDMGVRRVILGTAAISDSMLVAQASQKYGERVIVGIDSKNGFVAIEGWEATVGRTDLELAREIKKLGITRVVYTDTRRDGTLKGPNIKASSDLARESGLKVIVSGGVSCLDDVRSVKEIENDGIDGVIIGKALYAGTVDLKDALKIAKGEMI